MKTEMFQVDESDRGKRADIWLSEQMKISRSAAAKLLEARQVTCQNGIAVRKQDKVSVGTQISVILPEPENLELVPQDIPLDIIYEDTDVIVINKPRGMVVHPAPGHPDNTLVNALLYHCKDTLSGIGGVQRPGIVHRIDRDTSGLLIVAKNDFAHQALSEQLKDHSLARTYFCVVTGSPREDSGQVNANIGRHPVERKRMAVVREGRPAVTHWKVLARCQGYALLRCQLETGRTHQIRVHMAYMGHPVLGDTVYGLKKPVPGLQGQCLHAAALRFCHPRTGEKIQCTCMPPEDFCRQLRRFHELDKCTEKTGDKSDKIFVSQLLEFP